MLPKELLLCLPTACALNSQPLCFYWQICCRRSSDRVMLLLWVAVWTICIKMVDPVQYPMLQALNTTEASSKQVLVALCITGTQCSTYTHQTPFVSQLKGLKKWINFKEGYFHLRFSISYTSFISSRGHAPNSGFVLAQGPDWCLHQRRHKYTIPYVPFCGSKIIRFVGVKYRVSRAWILDTAGKTDLLSFAIQHTSWSFDFDFKSFLNCFNSALHLIDDFPLCHITVTLELATAGIPKVEKLMDGLRI